MSKDSQNNSKPLVNTQLLLSTDTLAGYGLDLIFDKAKELGFDGIDLAIWKNFDSWNINYVRKLSNSHNMPIKVIQTSGNVNKKELNLALDLCEATGADTIAINAPRLIDFKPYNFMIDNLTEYKKSNPDINFSIINPPDSNIFALPIPKYRFVNIVEIIKEQGCYLGLDISNIDEDALENDLMRKIDKFVPYISVLYLSDKTKLGKGHIIPGEGVLKINSFMKRLKQAKYNRFFSLKIDISKSDLSDSEKVDIILKKAKSFYDENYVNLKTD